jgi:hypothetical protein
VMTLRRSSIVSSSSALFRAVREVEHGLCRS